MQWNTHPAWNQNVRWMSRPKKCQQGLSARIFNRWLLHDSSDTRSTMSFWEEVQELGNLRLVCETSVETISWACGGQENTSKLLKTPFWQLSEICAFPTPATWEVLTSVPWLLLSLQNQLSIAFFTMQSHLCYVSFKWPCLFSLVFYPNTALSWKPELLDMIELIHVAWPPCLCTTNSPKLLAVSTWLCILWDCCRQAIL